MIGKKLDNRYEIKKQLGSGGMAVVYQGVDTLLDRLVTIKVLRDQFASDADYTRNFLREAQSVARLSHINIVSIFDMGIEDHQPYLVMEYVEGQNLKEYILQQGKLSIREAVSIAMQILAGLQHAHDHGVVHRDIKSHNILLSKDGQVKVTDFGIARAVSEATVTFNGSTSGSVQYISPEQALGTAIGPQSDIYSLGVVLYEMLTGQLPFNGDSPIAIAMQQVQQELVPPIKIVPEIPLALSQVVCRAMAKKTDHRYATAREMGNDLQKAMASPGEEILFAESDDHQAEGRTSVLPLINDRRVKKQPIAIAELKSKSPWLIGIAAIVIFLALAFAGYQASQAFWAADETQVPMVINKTLAEGQSILEEADLVDDVRYSTNDTIAKGLIISQSIAAGETVKKQQLVELVVSEGPPEPAVVQEIENGSTSSPAPKSGNGKNSGAKKK